MNFITSLIEGGNEIILAADINEHAVNSKLVKELKRIGIINVYFAKHSSSGPALYVKEGAQIDGVRTICNGTPSVVSILLYYFRVVNDRVALVDFEFK